MDWRIKLIESGETTGAWIIRPSAEPHLSITGETLPTMAL